MHSLKSVLLGSVLFLRKTVIILKTTVTECSESAVRLPPEKGRTGGALPGPCGLQVRGIGWVHSGGRQRQMHDTNKQRITEHELSVLMQQKTSTVARGISTKHVQDLC